MSLCWKNYKGGIVAHPIKGTLYVDGSSRGLGSSRRPRWVAEIFIKGRRKRKRGQNVTELGAWLSAMADVYNEEIMEARMRRKALTAMAHGESTESVLGREKGGMAMPNRGTRPKSSAEDRADAPSVRWHSESRTEADECGGRKETANS